METIICISDYWQNKTFYKITPRKSHVGNQNNRTVYDLKVLPGLKKEDVKVVAVSQKRKKCKRSIDGINFFYLNKELLEFFEFRGLLSTSLHNKGVQMLQLQIVQPEREIIDFKW